MMFKKAILGLLLLQVVSGISAQTFPEDIRKCQSTYLQAKNFKCTINVKVVSVESDQPVFVETYQIARKRNKYLYKVDDLTVLLGNSHCIMVVKNKKAIMVKNRQSDDADISNDLEIPNMDSMFNVFSSQSKIYDLGAVNNVKKYKIIFTNGYYTSATLDIDQTNYTLNKVVYSYNKSVSDFDGYALIEFKNVSVNGEISEDTFDERKYIVSGAAGIVPAVAYKGYELFEVDSFNK